MIDRVQAPILVFTEKTKFMILKDDLGAKEDKK